MLELLLGDLEASRQMVRHVLDADRMTPHEERNYQRERAAQDYEEAGFTVERHEGGFLAHKPAPVITPIDRRESPLEDKIYEWTRDFTAKVVRGVSNWVESHRRTE
jgi:hypothetical protein